MQHCHCNNIYFLEFATVRKLRPGQHTAVKAIHTTTAVGGGFGIDVAGTKLQA